jgi:hypothetical protein
LVLEVEKGGEVVDVFPGDISDSFRYIPGWGSRYSTEYSGTPQQRWRDHAQVCLAHSRRTVDDTPHLGLDPPTPAVRQQRDPLFVVGGFEKLGHADRAPLVGRDEGFAGVHLVGLGCLEVGCGDQLGGSGGS